MSTLRNNDYCNMPFTSEICRDDFYKYSNIASLFANCEKYKEKNTKICTIGILESNNGQFFLKDVDSANKIGAPKLLVSMAYVKSSLQSTIIPYTVQIFGTMQWTIQPVIHAQIVQVINTNAALRLNDAVQSICVKHLAKHV